MSMNSRPSRGPSTIFLIFVLSAVTDNGLGGPRGKEPWTLGRRGLTDSELGGSSGQDLLFAAFCDRERSNAKGSPPGRVH